ncbi:MAG TPA: serine kinase [Chloroflexi bacterium]|nr:serine kinase [Chloroflexota bacterium]
MTLRVHDVVSQTGWAVLAGADHLDHAVRGGYVADLLSCVMAGAEEGDLWITLQTHSNIVAVASLLGLAAIVVAEGAPVPEGTLTRAEEQEVVILSSPEPAYETACRLYTLGVR